MRLLELKDLARERRLRGCYRMRKTEFNYVISAVRWKFTKELI